MAVDHVKSTGITNLDATPRVPGTAGRYGANIAQVISGYATAVASSSVDATYQLVRVPTSAIIKMIMFESEAQGAGKFDLGVYYSTDGVGPNSAASLLAAAAVDQDFFAQAIDCASAVTALFETMAAGGYTLDKRVQPLWQALGGSSDPGGNYDIVATVKTTAVTTGTGKFGVTVVFTT